MSDDAMDVAVVKLGIGASARPEIQKAMDEIAATGDTSSPAGLVQMLREAIAVLRGLSSAWTHAAVTNASLMPPGEAQAKFEAAAHDARSRFKHQLVRNFDGRTERHDPPPLTPSGEPGRVVVTFVVAARRELRDVPPPGDRETLGLALDDLCALAPAEFVAMEVIWSPAATDDRMSLSAMEERYPELFALDEVVA